MARETHTHYAALLFSPRPADPRYTFPRPPTQHLRSCYQWEGDKLMRQRHTTDRSKVTCKRCLQMLGSERNFDLV